MKANELFNPVRVVGLGMGWRDVFVPGFYPGLFFCLTALRSGECKMDPGPAFAGLPMPLWGRRGDGGVRPFLCCCVCSDIHSRWSLLGWWGFVWIEIFSLRSKWRSGVLGVGQVNCRAGAARPTSLVCVAENHFVIPAKAGIHGGRVIKCFTKLWTPACAGVTLFRNKN